MGGTRAVQRQRQHRGPSGDAAACRVSPEAATRRAIEAAVRDHYGRLLALLASRSGNPAEAEDALADALAQALLTWPGRGVPDHPDAWLLTTARNVLRQGWRHQAMARTCESELVEQVEALLEQAYATEPVIADERLRLMFVCAHPAIDPRLRSALMLQLVLGIDVQRLASAFLVSPAALAQRLVRVKNKIRAAGIPFELPEASELAERTHDVLEAIYGAYTCGSGITDEITPDSAALADEALRLAEITAGLLPDLPEPLALHALLLYSDSRRSSRFDAKGAFVPLGRQDPAQWETSRIEAAEALLVRASAMRQPGPMQLEAAIQSAHCARRLGQPTPWPVIASLYDALCSHWPSVGASVGNAVAQAECGRIALALNMLDALDPAHTEGYAAYWTARAHVRSLAGDTVSAKQDRIRAAGLTRAAAVREYLLSE
jgi:RNA polymerase sigma-70 factor (ECF subfamily)